MKLRQWKRKTQNVLGIVQVLMGIDWLFWVLFGLLGELFACFRELLAELAGYRRISLDMSYYFLKAVFT